MYSLSIENKGTDELCSNCKTKALICVFVFTYADCLFSYAVAHLVTFCFKNEKEEMSYRLQAQRYFVNIAKLPYDLKIFLTSLPCELKVPADEY